VESSDLVADYPTVSLALAEHIDDFGGKVLQVVRATDTTLRSTTSSSFVDANISVTITPQKSTSAILLIWSNQVDTSGSSRILASQITDSSDNAVSGAEDARAASFAAALVAHLVKIGYATPATTSAVTYKGRFRSTTGETVQITNQVMTGQLFAIEVSE
jgi:hypothetical protein